MGWLAEIDDEPVTDGFDRVVLFSSEEAAVAAADMMIFPARPSE